ncbi:uncharacterized protein LOC141910117 [Tubulanus polymorphus]|uniref:uncharacterized protein LOC141910117 n=1 Tax=Tubulanus polymorphus TaxID=672921 RepID=UPI003DA2F203
MLSLREDTTLRIIALVLLTSLSWVEVKVTGIELTDGDVQHSLTERALTADVQGLLDESLGQEAIHARLKRTLTTAFKGKHFMTTAEFNGLGTKQSNWDREMTSRLAFYRRDPKIVSIIVENNDARLQTDTANAGNKVTGGQGSLYRTKNQYHVYDISVSVSISGGSRVAKVTGIVDRGDVTLILGYTKKDMAITMHYDHIDGSKANKVITLHR